MIFAGRQISDDAISWRHKNRFQFSESTRLRQGLLWSTGAMHCSEFKVKQQKWTFVISYDKKLGYFKEEIKNNIETQRVKK